MCENTSSVCGEYENLGSFPEGFSYCVLQKQMDFVDQP